ncbi:MAG: mechanosensitive ion channel family protein [Patescibacteria group bacterium]|nr:mechanosensitive ion channel family protein [Patescibacteria group bacterium]
MQEFLRITAYGNTLGDYFYTLLLFVLLMILFKVFTNYVLAKFEVLAKKTKTEWDNLLVAVLAGIRWPLYFALALFLSTRVLALEPNIEKGIWYILVILLTYEGVKAVQNIIEYGTDRATKNDSKNKATLKIINKFAKVVLWIIAVILILSNLGYNVSSLIAGLGIGGIAIALALQNILSDIFTSFTIYLDKPFEVGDHIIIDNEQGTIKKIGLKTTRIESLRGEEVVISNQDLTNSRVHNLKKMKNRRIVFTIGVTYETPQTKLKQIPKMIKEIFAKTGKATLDRVHFKEFGDFSLNYEIVYFVKSNEYKEYMDIQQRVNLAIKEAFEKKKIDFAYPTQTVFVQKNS